ncbi:MAG: hypothetical protein U0132_09275 [Gemmatimonadaceae bacterium]
MRQRYVAALITGFLPWLALNAQSAPSPDVFLVGIRMDGGVPTLTGVVKNVTARAGYDNQPSWSRDGSSIYYTSTREDAQADIYRYELASGTVTRVTQTAPESEYSATLTPDGKALSVIRVERDSTQRLWRFPLDGSAPSVILPGLKPAGYQAWASDRMMAVFVLGSPNALVLGDIVSQHVDTVARRVGRSLHRVPGSSHISYPQFEQDSVVAVMELEPATKGLTRRAELPRGVEDYAWTPNGRLIAGDGSRLVWWNGTAWTPIGDLGSHGLRQITRLAVSPRAKWIAVVAIPTAENR